jgi:hypothetical protein
MSNINKDEILTKVVTFFNLDFENVTQYYAGHILEPPNSVPVQIVTNMNGTITSRVINASGWKPRAPYYETHGQESPNLYSEILSISRTFVLSDSVFTEKGSSERFREYGLGKLIEFYKSGGRVVVLCTKGNSNIATLLDNHFGCHWCLVASKHEKCVPTTKARVFGSSIPEALDVRNGQFMITPKEEGLYQVRVLSEEEFFTERYDGFSSDEDLDDDEVAEAKQDYSHYVRENSGKFLIALHKHHNKGDIVWIGNQQEITMTLDEKEDNTTMNHPKKTKAMQPLLAKICCSKIL